MTRPAIIMIFAFCIGISCNALAGGITDATGRVVAVPDTISRVLPAGPPAAVLMEIIAPDLMLGWPHRPGQQAAAWLPPEVAALPELPLLSPPEAVAALHPDLILDYGTVDEGYAERAQHLQDTLHVPTILLDGRLALTPLTFRIVGRVLHREARAEELARLAEGVLASVSSHRGPRTVVYVHGAEGNEVAVPGGPNSELPEFLGWTLLAPPAASSDPEATKHLHPFRPATVTQIAALDPDLILFASPAMRERASNAPEWRAIRAIARHHAWVAPGQPFGWIEGPPSVNRLIGLAWLGSGEPDIGVVPFAAAFHAAAYGRVPTPPQIAALRESLQPIEP